MKVKNNQYSKSNIFMKKYLKRNNSTGKSKQIAKPAWAMTKEQLKVQKES